MYTSAIPMMFSGVFISTSTGLVNITESAVRRTVKNKHSNIACPTLFLSLFSSFAPKNCAGRTAKPPAIPVEKPFTRKFNEPVEPTAARASVPRL